MKKKITLSVLCALLSTISFAQVFPYIFTNFTEDFEYIQGGVSVNNGEIWDDPEYVIPVGFNYELFGNVNTALITVSTGGVLVGDNINKGTGDAIMPFMTDICDRGLNEDGSLSPITALTEGDKGSRVFTLEFKNASYWGDLEVENPNPLFDFANVQIRIFESDYTIQYRYGASQSLQADSITHYEFGAPVIGLINQVQFNSGNSAGTFILDGTHEEPVVAGTTENIFDNGPSSLILGVPPANTVYQFTPGFVSVEEESALQVVAYPNPVGETLQLQVIENCNIRVFDQAGKIAIQTQLQPGLQQLDFSQLSSGLYVLEMEQEGQVARQKIMHQ